MSKRWAFLRRFDIADPDTGELYLRRWYLLTTPWFGVMMHKITTPDKDRHLHDHPWSFVSLVLRGGYDERLGIDTTEAAIAQRPPHTATVRRGWLSLGFRRATDAHRIVRLHRTPTWTLVFTGPRRRSWGFYADRGYVDWREYLGIDGSSSKPVAGKSGPATEAHA